MPDLFDNEPEKNSRIRYPFKLRHVAVIYEAYPKHVAPASAEKAIEKALNLVPFADLLAAVQAYAKSVAGKDQQYIPMPASWFNAGQWANEDSKPQDFTTDYHKAMKRMGDENAENIRRWKRGDDA